LAGVLACVSVSSVAGGCGRLREAPDGGSAPADADAARDATMNDGAGDATTFDGSADVPTTATDAAGDTTTFDAVTDVLVVAPDAAPITLDAGSDVPTTAALPEAAGLIGCHGALPYAGPLCQGGECVVLGRSVPVGAFGGGYPPPALALGNDCQPHIAYGSNDSSFSGASHLTLEGGVWRSEDIAPGGNPLDIVVDPATQVPSVIVKTEDPTDSSLIFSLWRREAPGWTNLGALDGTFEIYGDLARDPNGTLHVIRTPAANSMARDYGTFDGSNWTFQMLNGPFSIAELAFSTTGVAHFTYATNIFAIDEGDLLWSPLGQTPELITTGVYGPSRLAVSDADPGLPSGTPHVIFVRGRVADGQNVTMPSGVDGLSYATRTKDGWIVSAIREAGTLGAPACPTPASGVTCDYDYDAVAPLAILATKDGQVRMLYLYYHYKGTTTPAWSPLDQWHWQSQRPQDTQLWMAWPSGNDRVSSVLLLDQFDVAYYADLFYHPTQAAIDSLGRIHLVALMSDGSLSYLVIGRATAPR
jgi:hypothetical protein